MTSAPIRFYMDPISQNAYLAWELLPALAARHGRTVEPVPVLFAGLLGAYGQMGPAEVPPKLAWMYRNNLRKAARLGLPLHRPAFHPFNPLLSLRVASLPMDEAARARLVTGLLRAVWAESRHVSEPEVMADVARSAGLDGAMLVAAAQTPEAKERVKRQTDDAIAAGVFGVPTMIVDGELFWGYDDFPQLERFLAGDDSLDPAALAEWSTPAPRSAMRQQHRERTSGSGH